MTMFLRLDFHRCGKFRLPNGLVRDSYFITARFRISSLFNSPPGVGGAAALFHPWSMFKLVSTAPPISFSASFDLQHCLLAAHHLASLAKITAPTFSRLAVCCRHFDYRDGLVILVILLRVDFGGLRD